MPLFARLKALGASPAFTRVVAGAWGLSLLLGLLVPVYSDEVGWRLQERAGLDGVDKLYSEQCGPDTLARPLWFMWPVRWYSGYFNGAFPDPLWVRVSGVAYVLAWGWMVLALLRRMEAGRAATVLVVGLLGLGTLPLQLVWSRPEQPILLCLTAALLLAWDGQSRASWWRAPAMVALGVIALSYHFKALLLVPVFVLCALLADRRRATLALRVLAGFALVGLAVASAQHWFARLSCAGDPLLAAQHAEQSLHFDPQAGIFGHLLTLLGNYNLPAYVTLAAPDVTPMSHWLPYHLVSKPEQIAWSAVMIALWFFGFLLAGGALWRAVKGRWRAAICDLRVVFALLLYGAASAYGAAQVVRNVYEAAFVLPLLAMAYGAALSATPASPRAQGWAGLTGAAMLLSMVLVGAIYGPSLVGASRASGYLAEQPLSVPVFHYAQARERITRAAGLCGITPDNHTQRLLIDDASYFTFMATRLPDHHLSVLDPQWRGGISDPLAYLRAQGMDGVVVACRFMEPHVRAKAREYDGVCCLSRADF